MSRRELLLYLKDFGWNDVEAAAAAALKRERQAASAQQAPPRHPAETSPGTAQPPAADPLAAASLDEMAAALAGCRRCRLCQGRKQVVFGVGNPSARVMFVGEGPGADEDRLGEPFVGKAGQLLNSMLRAMGMRREDVYIANIVKCRPPGNRDPQDDEAASCMPLLRRQIELIDPAVIVTLGRIAARFLLGTTAPISTYRGRWTTWQGRDVLPTFHPAYLLRNPAAKAQSWQDLKRLLHHLGRAS